MVTTTALPPGYYQVPPGQLVNAVTWLEMRAPPADPLAEPLPLRRAGPGDREALDRLYAAVGTPWLWSRAAGAPDGPPGDAFLASDDGRDVGVVEFAGRDGAEVEIAYFGLLPGATGRGLGRRLMAAALDLAWRGARRVWLHTCSFDHPGALPFYRACGFEPYAVGFEIMADPRLEGRLPAGAAPQVPVIRPAGQDTGRTM